MSVFLALVLAAQATSSGVAPVNNPTSPVTESKAKPKRVCTADVITGSRASRSQRCRTTDRANIVAERPQQAAQANVAVQAKAKPKRVCSADVMTGSRVSRSQRCRTTDRANVAAEGPQQAVQANVAVQVEAKPKPKQVCSAIVMTGSRVSRPQRCRASDETAIEADNSRQAAEEAGRLTR